MSIIMKQGLVNLESLHQNSENIEGFYKADNFFKALKYVVIMSTR